MAPRSSDVSGSPRLFSRARRYLTPVTALLVVGFAIHLLLPQVGELGQGIRALRSGRWPFLALTVAGSVLTYVASAWMVRASVDETPGWRQTTLVQVAASAAAVVTPVGIGWALVNQRFLVRHGTQEPDARAATGLNVILTLTSHVALLVVMALVLPSLTLPTVAPTQKRIFVDIVVVAAAVGGIAIWIPRSRRRILSSVGPTLEAVPDLLRNPRRSGMMVLAALAANLAFGLSLYGAVAAFGAAASPVGVLVAYLVGATVSAIAPTPGGVGAMESALVASLTRVGIPAGQAVGATLAFRLASFWVPLAIGAVILRVYRKRSWL